MPNWEAIYVASASGDVYRTGKGAGARVGKRLTPRFWRDPRRPEDEGYARITLCDAPRREQRSLHSVICETFHGPRPSPAHQCNHKNGNKLDNRASNLEWATAAENNQHAIDTGLRVSVGEKHYAAKLTEDDVREIRRRYRKGVYGCGYKALASEFGLVRFTVQQIIARKTWKSVV